MTSLLPILILSTAVGLWLKEINYTYTLTSFFTKNHNHIGELYQKSGKLQESESYLNWGKNSNRRITSFFSKRG